MSKLNVKVGQEVTLRALTNEARSIRMMAKREGREAQTEDFLEQGMVVSVGRVYFDVTGLGSRSWWKERFHLDGGYQKTEYSADWKAYENRQEVFDEIEGERLFVEIKNRLASKHSPTRELTFDQIKRIYAILNEVTP